MQSKTNPQCVAHSAQICYGAVGYALYAAAMTWIFWVLHLCVVAAMTLRILWRTDLRPDVRMGWLVTMVLLPVVSCVLYYLFGEVALRRGGRTRHVNVHDYMQRSSEQALPSAFAVQQAVRQSIDPAWHSAFGYAASINGFAPYTGHHAELMADGATARARMLQDMDAAQHEIHVLYYIWLDDHTGQAVAQALIRAAQRGVQCRAMVDGLGSRAMVNSALWKQMAQAGVEVAVALPLSHPLRVLLTSRIDLRNHRKITLIDRHITYCGSQNCADEAFLPKAEFAPWVDIMLRLQGPVVAQMQWVFASDWNQSDATPFPTPAPLTPTTTAHTGFAALAIAEGPTERPRSTSELVSVLLACAQEEAVISTPYFVPDATVLDALCAAAWRGVQVTLITPARNDSAFVAAASRSYYHRLLQAGVDIYEFKPGLLHAKTLTVDGQVCLLGSTNLDLRSFDLNFENNVLLQDHATTQAVRARQDSYMQQSTRITLEQLKAWPWWLHIWNNLLATLSPVL